MRILSIRIQLLTHPEEREWGCAKWALDRLVPLFLRVSISYTGVDAHPHVGSARRKYFSHACMQLPTLRCPHADVCTIGHSLRWSPTYPQINVYVQFAGSQATIDPSSKAQMRTQKICLCSPHTLNSWILFSPRLYLCVCKHTLLEVSPHLRARIHSTHHLYTHADTSPTKDRVSTEKLRHSSHLMCGGSLYGFSRAPPPLRLPQIEPNTPPPIVRPFLHSSNIINFCSTLQLQLEQASHEVGSTGVWPQLQKNWL